MKKLVELLKRTNPFILETEKKIVTDGVVDSVDLVGIITEIEEEFGIDIPIDDISPENFDSVDDMWNLIQKLM